MKVRVWRIRVEPRGVKRGGKSDCSPLFTDRLQDEASAVHETREGVRSLTRVESPGRPKSADPAEGVSGVLERA
jgi:hypothetical protein